MNVEGNDLSAVDVMVAPDGTMSIVVPAGGTDAGLEIESAAPDSEWAPRENGET